MKATLGRSKVFNQTYQSAPQQSAEAAFYNRSVLCENDTVFFTAHDVILSGCRKVNISPETKAYYITEHTVVHHGS